MIALAVSLSVVGAMQLALLAVHLWECVRRNERAIQRTTTLDLEGKP